MSNKVKLKVNIAGRHYPMTVNSEEEEIIRSAGKEINKLIKDFEEKYDIRDKQDALAMCALQYVSKSLGLEKKDSESNESQQMRLRKLIDNLHQHI